MGRAVPVDDLPDSPQSGGRVVPADDLPTTSPAKHGFADTARMALKVFAPGLSNIMERPQEARNAVGGAVRGAGSGGATAMRVLPNALGGDNAQENAQRRKDMDSALQSMGADPESGTYQANKLLSEVALTAGAGGGLAGLLSKIPGVATKAPAILDAIRTSGMTANGMTGAKSLIPRMIGGGVTGGAAAGMINPEDATTGAVIGTAAPPVFMGAGKLGGAIVDKLKGPAQSADLTQAINKAREAGYVIPPTQAKPTLMNRLLEGMSGKITTAQNASARNQSVTNRLVSNEIGFPKDDKLTVDALEALRKQAGSAYADIGNSGVITPGKAYATALDDIAAPFLKAAEGFPGAKASPVLEIVESLKSPSFDASSAVAKIKELRTAADDAFRKGDTDIGRASKGAAKALEDAIEAHLETTGKAELLDGFRKARQLIAKTYSVEKALNTTTGNVDARKLAAMITKDKPLSGGLKDAGEFAQRFPKASQMPEAMGSLPQASPLDWTAAGGVSMATGNPLALAGVLARPVARFAALSSPVQNRLAQKPINGELAKALLQFQQPAYRIAPLAPAIAGD